ncbi:MAG: DUF4065 domain-containing protein [Gemmatimonadetes bacterium]|nr:DUF4065 domain-containing protein [Gemmatimonadota bacterium]
MGYSAFAVANYFLDLAKKDGVEVTPLMIQKLVYIAHGYHLAFTARDNPPDGLPLVDDEFAEAWQYGPVFPSLYHHFKHFGRNPITEPAQDVDFSDVDGELRTNITTPEIDQDDKYTRALLDKIWEVYGEYTGLQLSDITHREDTPWDKTWKKAEGFRNAHILNKDIKEYYLKRINRD